MTRTATSFRRLAACVLAFGAACAAASCGREPPPLDAPAKAAMEKRAAAAADRLTSALMSELSAALDKGGPEGAVRVCGDVAQRIADDTAKSEGLVVRRTTLRTRNPANAPDAWESSVLRSWETGQAAEVSEVVDGPQGREVRFMRPIRVRALCTVCHGTSEQIGAAVRTALLERYPKDSATGYREGDLRGAISVRVPAGAASPR